MKKTNISITKVWATVYHVDNTSFEIHEWFNWFKVISTVTQQYKVFSTMRKATDRLAGNVDEEDLRETLQLTKRYGANSKFHRG